MTYKTGNMIQIGIDWLSFTVIDSFGFGENDPQEWRDSERASKINQYLYSLGVAESFVGISQKMTRKPYNRVLPLRGNGGHLFFANALNYATAEFEGTGCQRIEDSGQYAMRNLLLGVLDRITRLDIAVDIETDTSPVAFCDRGYSPRFTTYHIAKSESGETYYVGAPTSDLMCRVYRYADPHPRSHLLRIEFVCRRERAQTFAKAYATDFLQAARQLQTVFGFQHPDIMPLDGATRLTTPRIRPDTASTMRWVVKQVRPALMTLAADSSIPPEWWWSVFAGLPGWDSREGGPEVF